MPNAYELRLTDEFVKSLAGIYSTKVLSEIRNILEILTAAPEIGSRNVRPALCEQFGNDIRKIPVSRFVIVYRIVNSEIRVLGLVYGPSIR